MRTLVKLVALLLVLISLSVLGYGAYWMSPEAFMVKLRLVRGALGGDIKLSEKGVICDFETPRDLMSWKTIGCEISLSTGYRRSGSYSGSLSFNGGTGYARAKLEDYVFGPGSVRDWSSFERLSFWLKNEGADEFNFLLQVKDAGERRFYHSTHLGQGTEERVSIELEELSDTVDLTRISSVIVGTRGPVGETEIFIDEIKLEGEGDPLSRPYITFSGMEIPPVSYRGETFMLNGYLRAEKAVPGDYRVFLHIYPEDQASVAETSGRAGLINADHDPRLRTSLWRVGVDEPVGPLGIYIPEDNPAGTYVIEMGLFNPGSPGKGERGIEYQGAYDFTGTYPKCRYTNERISGYVVGRMEVF